MLRRALSYGDRLSQALRRIEAQQTITAAELQGVTILVHDFGEDCVRQDGTSTFGAMETDFDVTLLVDDAKDLEYIGSKTAAIIQALEPILGKGSAQGVIRLPISDSNGAQPMLRIEQQQVSEIVSQNLTGSLLTAFLAYNPQ